MAMCSHESKPQPCTCFYNLQNVCLRCMLDRILVFNHWCNLNVCSIWVMPELHIQDFNLPICQNLIKLLPCLVDHAYVDATCSILCSLFLHGTCCSLASEEIYFAKTYNAHVQNNMCKSGYEFIYQTEQFARKLC